MWKGQAIDDFDWKKEEMQVYLAYDPINLKERQMYLGWFLSEQSFPLMQGLVSEVMQEWGFRDIVFYMLL